MRRSTCPPPHRCDNQITVIKLDIRPADGDRFDIPVESDSVVIGRSTSADVSIADRFLSRRHARLYRDDDDWLIEDLGSRNGTLVNGARISAPTAVGPGDVIGISASIVEVCAAPTIADPNPSTPAPARSSVAASAILGESKKAMSRPDIVDPEELRRAADQLRVLVDVHQALAESMTVEELFDRVLDRVFVHLQPQNGAIFLVEDDALVRVASRSTAADRGRFPRVAEPGRRGHRQGLGGRGLRHEHR